MSGADRNFVWLFHAAFLVRLALSFMGAVAMCQNIVALAVEGAKRKWVNKWKLFPFLFLATLSECTRKCLLQPCESELSRLLQVGHPVVTCNGGVGAAFSAIYLFLSSAFWWINNTIYSSAVCPRCSCSIKIGDMDYIIAWCIFFTCTYFTALPLVLQLDTVDVQSWHCFCGFIVTTIKLSEQQATKCYCGTAQLSCLASEAFQIKEEFLYNQCLLVESVCCPPLESTITCLEFIMLLPSVLLAILVY